MTQTKVLKPREVAARLSCSVGQVYQLIKSRQIGHITVGVKKGFRITEAELERWLKERAERTPAISSPSESPETTGSPNGGTKNLERAAVRE
jgi:excisionase family DNA binding protein